MPEERSWHNLQSLKRKEFDMAEYYSYEKDAYTCRFCGWKGLGKDCVTLEGFEGLFEIGCPKCKEKVGNVQYPLVSEMRNSDNAVDRATAALATASQNLFQSQCLKSPEQLPDIDEDFIVLIWDLKENPGDLRDRTIIKHGGRIIWDEPFVYEGFVSFMEVGDILKKKYGNRLKDIIPTDKSKMDLYGDDLASPRAVANYRKSFSEKKGGA